MNGNYLKRKWKHIWKEITESPARMRRYYLQKRIGKPNLTIISNNCWAGRAYQYLDMPYLSPTVGLYFFAEDYLKFVSNLRYYLSLELRFIPAEKSKYYAELLRRRHTGKPIGILDDVEIVFLHYHSNQEALEKWNRRKARVNYENILLKFSRMNLCEETHMMAFARLPFSNKLIINNRKKPRYACEVYYNGDKNLREMLLDTKPFPGNLHLTKLLKRATEPYHLTKQDGRNGYEHTGSGT